MNMPTVRCALVMVALAVPLVMAVVAVPSTDLYQPVQVQKSNTVSNFNLANLANLGFHAGNLGLQGLLSTPTIGEVSFNPGNLGFLGPQTTAGDEKSTFNTGNLGFLKPQAIPSDGKSDSNKGNLGFLKPQATPTDGDFTAIMLDLLPEFTAVLKKFGGAQSAQLSPTEAVSSFFPIVRKALEAKAKKEGRALTKEEQRLLSLSETAVCVCSLDV